MVEGTKLSMKLTAIDRVAHISAEEFQQHYFNRRPVVFTKMSESWPAYSKWNFSYMREMIGDKVIPLYRTGDIDPKSSFNAPTTQMRFSEYIDLLEKGPTDLRVFLLNALKLNPELENDFSTPHVANGFVDSYPTLFFGSQNAFVFLHYDLDMGHVFHTQFVGQKRAVLFSREHSTALYQIPFSVRSFMDLDAESPDFEKYPALKYAQGFATTLEHGDTLYIPSGWWHQLRYLSTGFGLSQRAIASTWSERVKAIYNMGIMPAVENIARKTAGESWMSFKHQWAKDRAQKLMTKLVKSSDKDVA